MGVIEWISEYSPMFVDVIDYRGSTFYAGPLAVVLKEAQGKPQRFIDSPPLNYAYNEYHTETPSQSMTAVTTQVHVHGFFVTNLISRVDLPVYPWHGELPPPFQ